MALTVLAAVVVGALIAAQSRINSELARSLSDGYLASTISFGSGLLILLCAILVFKPGRHGMARVWSSARRGEIPWWHLAGGTAGALFVLSQGLSGAVLGVALFTVAVVCGQTLSGLILDRRGIGTTPPAPFTVTRVAGTLLALAAVGLALSSQFALSTPAWVLILPFLSGLVISVQQALNGQVRVVAQSALAATFLNFAVGTTVLVIACIIHELFVGLPSQLPSNPLLYLGGAIGVVFIGCSVVLVRISGVLLLGLGSVAGQLVASLVLNFMQPLQGQTIAATTITGTLLTLVAVGIAAVPSRALGRRSSR